MKTKEFGHKATEDAFCQGYHDEHGHWNNGFYCPMWAGPDKQYCCGPETHRHCCVENEQQAETANTTTYVQSQDRFVAQTPIYQDQLHVNDEQISVPLVVGLSISMAVVCIVALVLFCVFCKCCLLYKRRKRRFEDFDGMTGEEMRRFFSNEFVLVPGQGAFCPGVLEASEHSSQKSLCPRELQFKRSNIYNVNEAYSSSNVSDVTQRNSFASCMTSQLELTNGCPAQLSNTLGPERDSGCYVTQNENELSGVSSLFATLDRGTMGARERYDQMYSCSNEECSNTELLHGTMEQNDTDSSQSSDVDENEQNQMITEVHCCQRNSDPHMHSKV